MSIPPENLYAAVRIVDNCGMINVNTALRYPDPTVVTAGGAQWDGSRLSHVNLEGIRSQSDIDDGLTGEVIQGCRSGLFNNTPGLLLGVCWATDSKDYHNYNHYDFDTKYETDVALRLLNPNIYTIGRMAKVLNMNMHTNQARCRFLPALHNAMPFHAISHITSTGIIRLKRIQFGKNGHTPLTSSMLCSFLLLSLSSYRIPFSMKVIYSPVPSG